MILSTKTAVRDKLYAFLRYPLMQGVILIVCCYLLFNTVFFLGTNPTQVIDSFFQRLFRELWSYLPQSWVRDFVIYGLLTGIAGFLVYVPNIVLMFFFSHILFQSNLTVKASRIVDPFFRIFGLSGRSFSALIFGFGCTVNALQASQHIREQKGRLVTMLIAPFMSCGSKVGVYVLLVSVIFKPQEAGSILFLLYSTGIILAIVSSVFMRALLRIPRSEASIPIEDAPLKKPDLAASLKGTLRDAWIFIYKSGGIIIIASLLIWATSYFPGISVRQYEQFEQYGKAQNRPVPPLITLSLHNSYLARFGQWVEPAFKPLGQNWKNSIAIISSVAGRTIIISTLVTLYGIEHSPESSQTLTKALQADPSFSRLSAITLMLFVLLCGSCLASIALFHHATKSIILTGLFVLYPIITAWIISTGFYQLMRIIGVAPM